MTALAEALEAIRAFLETGGPVLWWIGLLALVLWTLLLERFWFFRFVYPRRLRTWVTVWHARANKVSWHAQRIREAMVSQANIQLGWPLGLIKTLIALCPLLGLLGTITGMIEVFDVMAVLGTGNARALAAGISRATIPTMAGLVIALTGIYLSSRLERGVRIETERLADMLRYE